MAYSASMQYPLACPECGTFFMGDIWTTIDTAARPDLLARVYEGTIHQVACPNGHAVKASARLLLYRPDEEPRLIFSPPGETLNAEDARWLAVLAKQLRSGLDKRGFLGFGRKKVWQDAWLQNSLQLHPRGNLAAGPAFTSLTGIETTLNPAEVLDLMAKDMDTIHPRAAIAGTLTRYIQLPPDITLYRFLIDHPELLTDEAYALLGNMLAEVTAQGNDVAAQVLDKYLDLLYLSREMGVAQGFAILVGMTPEELQAATEEDAGRKAALEAFMAALAAGGIHPSSEEEALDVFFASLADGEIQASSEEEYKTALRARRELLAKVAGMSEEGDETALWDALIAVIRAETWIDAYRFLVNHLELLSDKTDLLLRRLEHGAMVAGAEANAQVYTEHRELLQRSREVGALAAYAEKLEMTAEKFELFIAIDNLESAEGLTYELDSVQELIVSLLDRPELLASLATLIGRDTLEVPPEYRRDFVAAASAIIRYETTKDMAGLDEATKTWEKILQDPGFANASEVFRLEMLNNAGRAFQFRFRELGNFIDLERYIGFYQEAVKQAPSDFPDRMLYLNNLGTALIDRYEHTGKVEDLDTAIVACAEAVENTPADSPNRALFQSNLGRGLIYRYHRMGQLADLSAAIIEFGDAVQLTPIDSANRAMFKNNLGIALSSRYSRTNEMADLEAAISEHEDALRITPVESPYRATIQHSLGDRLIDRFKGKWKAEDLDAAIDAFEDALRMTLDDSPNRAGIQSSLGRALLLRIEYGTGRAEDLDAAIATFKDAVRLTPADSLDRAPTLCSLGNGLRARYERTGQATDLDAAIEIYEEAVRRTPADSPNRALAMNDLSLGLRLRYKQTRMVKDLDAAIAAGEDILTSLDRALLASPLNYALGQQSNWTSVYSNTVTFLCEAGRPGLAMAVAEGAKSRLLSGLLGRGELPAPEVIPSDLVEQERELAYRLNALDAAGLSTRGHEYGIAGETDKHIFSERLALVNELRALWSQIETFGLEAADYVAIRRGDRPSWDGLSRMGASFGPQTALLSLYNTSERTFVFLLRSGADEPVVHEMDWSDGHSFEVFIPEYLEPYLDEIIGGADFRANGQQPTHRWQVLGRKLLGPLLPHLSDIEYLILSPEGKYHGLPLHALWLNENGKTLIDFCAVSYSPGLGITERLYRRSAKDGEVVRENVVMGYTPADPTTDRGQLEHELFLGEAESVRQLMGGELFLDEAATGSALRTAVDAPLHLLHLSCHGYFSGRDALESGVLLADGVYTARQFMKSRLPVNLVTLSACQTAMNSSLGGDEMAGLSLALLTAGADSLVLGLWSVNAYTTRAMMLDFYDRLRPAGGLGPAATKAVALRQTMLAMRAGRLAPPQPGFDPADPYYWAPFVLVGDWT